MLENLHKYHIYLASKSPRRRELLAMLRIPFTIINLGGIDESYPDNIPALEVPQYLSNLKANAYCRNLKPDELVITADTLVIMGDRIFGKPKDLEEAREMLTILSGKVHKVSTGVAISTLDRRTSFRTDTEVKFNDISEEDIKYYIDNYQPLDKAGAYGIQEWIGAVSVEWINGSYYNVMGLPLQRLYQELKLF